MSVRSEKIYRLINQMEQGGPQTEWRSLLEAVLANLDLLADNIAADDSGGMDLLDDGGNLGIHIADGGKVNLASGTGINEISTDTDLAGNSDDAVPTEKAVKTYVDDANKPSDVDIYGGLEDAVAAIGATPLAVIINTTQTLTANLTIPATLSLIVLKPGLISCGAYTLTINGPFEAGLYQVFNEAGTIDFGGGGSVKGVYPQWWGAKGDGTIDDTTAIQSALDSTYGKIIFPAGSYRTTDPIIGTRSGTIIEGSSGGPYRLLSSLYADHLDGPALILRNSGQCAIRDFNIDSSATRTAGPVGDNYGLLIEPIDAVGEFNGDFTLTRMNVRRQPGHGIVFAGSCRRGIVEQVWSRDNKGHGWLFNDGSLSSRSNLGVLGMIEVRSCTAAANGGNGVVVGSEDSAYPSFRIAFRNFECSDNATDAGVRISAHQMWMRGKNHEISLSAFRGILGGANFSGGIYIIGQDIYLNNNRFVDTTSCYELGSDVSIHCVNVKIDGFRVFDDTIGADQASAVIIPSDAISTFVRCGMNTAHITNMLSDSGEGTEAHYGEDTLKTYDGFSRRRTSYSKEMTTVVDDGFLVFDVGQKFYGATMLLYGNVSTHLSGLFWLRSHDTNSAIIKIAAINDANTAYTTGALNGTTGADNKITLSVDNTGRIYLENRMGSTRLFGLIIFGAT